MEGCGRNRNNDLRACEFTRDEQADILDAAGRPPARGLGAEAIRFSMRPQMGGRTVIVEAVGDGAGGGRVQVFTLSGHWRTSWVLEGSHRFALRPGEFRQLAAIVDGAIANRVLPPPGQEQRIVCMDGPGSLTERVHGGVVQNLVGSCPPSENAHHPNEVIAQAMQDMLCRRFDPASARRYWERDCGEQLRTMAQHQRDH